MNSLVGLVAVPLVGLADSIGSLGLGRAVSLPHERSKSHEGRRPEPHERSESYEGCRPESYERASPAR